MITQHQRIISIKKEKEEKIKLLEYEKIQHLVFLFQNNDQIHQYISFIQNLKAKKHYFLFFNNGKWPNLYHSFLNSLGFETFFYNQPQLPSFLKSPIKTTKKFNIIQLISVDGRLPIPKGENVIPSSSFFSFHHFEDYWKEYSLFFQIYSKYPFPSIQPFTCPYDLSIFPNDYLYLVQYLDLDKKQLKHTFALHYKDNYFCLYLDRNKYINKTIPMLKFLKKSRSAVSIIQHKLLPMNSVCISLEEYPWIMVSIHRFYHTKNKIPNTLIYKDKEEFTLTNDEDNAYLLEEDNYPRVENLSELISQIPYILNSPSPIFDISDLPYYCPFHRQFFHETILPNKIYLVSLLYEGQMIKAVFNSFSQFHLNFGDFSIKLYSTVFPNFVHFFNYTELHSFQIIDSFEPLFSSRTLFPIILSTREIYYFYDGNQLLSIQLSNDMEFKMNYKTGLFKFQNKYYNIYLFLSLFMIEKLGLTKTRDKMASSISYPLSPKLSYYSKSKITSPLHSQDSSFPIAF